MGTPYKRRDRDFESRLAQRADELREQQSQEAADLVWALVLLTLTQDEREGS